MANIGSFLNKIKTAIYGKDVRGSIHDGMEAINKETEVATLLSKETKNKQSALEKKYDEQIANMTNENPSISELVDFRTSGFTGETFVTAGKRADAVDATLDETTKKLKKSIESDAINMILQGVPTTGKGFANDKINGIIGLIQSGVILNKTLDFKNFKIDLNTEIIIPWGINIVNVYINVHHSDKSALRFQGRHTVDNISFNYPKQDMTGQNIIDYPAAIICDSTMGYASFTNINLGNAYRGIDFSSGISGGTIIYNVLGYPLYRGVIVNRCIDVLHIDRVHFNPNYYGVPDVRLKTWVWQNGIAVECGRYDFGNINRVFAWGYRSPFKVTSSPDGGAANNISFTNWLADACQMFCEFDHHDGGLKFLGGIGTFYNPYIEEQKKAGILVPEQSNFCGVIRGGSNGVWGGRIVHFKNNRIYRAENHGIRCSDPVVFTGNEITRYANAYTIDDTNVIDGLQLVDGSEGSIVSDNLFNGMNRAQNRCIAITTKNGNHRVDNNFLDGWKAADIYGRENNGMFNGIFICDSENRPKKGLYKGLQIFDITFNKSLVWDGTKWVTGKAKTTKTITSPGSGGVDASNIDVIINNGLGQYVINSLGNAENGRTIHFVNAGKAAECVIKPSGSIKTPNDADLIINHSKMGATCICTEGNIWRCF